MKGARSILLIPEDPAVMEADLRDGRLPLAGRDARLVWRFAPFSDDDLFWEWALALAHDGKPLRLSVLWLHDIVWPGQVIGARNLMGVVILAKAAEAKGLGRAVFLDKDGKEMER